jgi:hypothetical protein
MKYILYFGHYICIVTNFATVDVCMQHVNMNTNRLLIQNSK